MRWKQWDDEQGRCFVADGYVIRQLDDGWLLDGHGLHERGKDAELLKITAEDHARKHSRVAVGVGAAAPPPSPPEIDVSEYASDVRELRRTAKRLAATVAAVNPYRHASIAGSRGDLEQIRDELQLIIERLP